MVFPIFANARKMIKEMEELEREKGKYLEARKQAQNSLNNSVNHVSYIQERLEEEGISFQPSYGVGKDGKPVTDEQRTKEYKTSLEKVEARQKQLWRRSESTKKN